MHRGTLLYILNRVKAKCKQTPKISYKFQHVNVFSKVILSTDAEKAFNRVDWCILQHTLSRIGLGPQAAVRVNDSQLDYFPHTNGTRQCCPLSLLIFILTLEPFLCMIWASPSIQGIQTSTLEHKISAFADNFSFLNSNPNLATVFLPYFVYTFQPQ